MEAALSSEWGKLFANWADQKPDARGYPDVGAESPELVRTGVKHFMEGARLATMAVLESPELQARKRRRDLEAQL